MFGWLLGLAIVVGIAVVDAIRLEISLRARERKFWRDFHEELREKRRARNNSDRGLN
jgi:predicted outer membrane lipoprotein